MTERRTEAPRRGTRRLATKGTEMSENTISTEITVRPAAASFAAWIAAKVDDVDSLSFDEVVELTFEHHAAWQGSPERRAEREDAKVAREIAAAEAKEKREAERATRLLEEKAKLEAKLAKLSSK